MKILFDIVHPAHVHFFRHIITGLEARGHETFIVARDKDVTLSLLDHYGFDYVSFGRAGRKSRPAQLMELVLRDIQIIRTARRFKPDVIMTRNPAGVQAARLIGAFGIFDTDDGRAAGVHFKAAAPFANIITTPDCLNESYGQKHVKYPGYKQTAYLHPDHFKPDYSVLSELGVSPGEKYFLVRLVEMAASHDRGESGLSREAQGEIIRRLEKHGKVFITSEAKLPEELKHLRISVPPHRIHDVMAFAALVIGDSQTMAAEAAVIGTPALRVSSFALRLDVFRELEDRYGIVRSFHPGDIG
ncbi:MAG: DUF354 domain-containing protein, partial [Deltaproteobacteria bacterium]|nr:DUF354 domain-containing protein [Deltaproteobacteria bacterium]